MCAQVPEVALVSLCVIALGRSQESSKNSPGKLICAEIVLTSSFPRMSRDCFSLLTLTHVPLDEHVLPVRHQVCRGDRSFRGDGATPASRPCPLVALVKGIMFPFVSAVPFFFSLAIGVVTTLSPVNGMKSHAGKEQKLQRGP